MHPFVESSEERINQYCGSGKLRREKRRKQEDRIGEKKDSFLVFLLSVLRQRKWQSPSLLSLYSFLHTFIPSLLSSLWDAVEDSDNKPPDSCVVVIVFIGSGCFLCYCETVHLETQREPLRLTGIISSDKWKDCR